MSFEFSLTRRDRTMIVRVADGDAPLDVLVDAFESFLRAAEYHPDSIRRALGVPELPPADPESQS